MTAHAAILEPVSEVRPKALSGPRAHLEAIDKLELAERIARMHDVTVEQMMSRKRGFEAVSCARHHLWAELYATGNWSLPRIAGLCGRDHTTILSGINAHKKRRGEL